MLIIIGLRQKFQLEATFLDFKCGNLGRELDMGQILVYNIKFAWFTNRIIENKSIRHPPLTF